MPGNALERPGEPNVRGRKELVLLQRAQQMRSHLTPSEERLWQVIRSQQLGVAFRRQVVIGRYILDFCALSSKLIVEVDGSVHALERASDRRRTEKLERAGYRVLRLDARIVTRDLPRALRCTLGDRAARRHWLRRDVYILEIIFEKPPAAGDRVVTAPALQHPRRQSSVALIRAAIAELRR